MKPRCGHKLINGVEVPQEVVIRKNSEGIDVIISSISLTEITFKRLTDGTYYSVPYNLKIVEMFNFNS